MFIQGLISASLLSLFVSGEAWAGDDVSPPPPSAQQGGSTPPQRSETRRAAQVCQHVVKVLVGGPDKWALRTCQQELTIASTHHPPSIWSSFEDCLLAAEAHEAVAACAIEGSPDLARLPISNTHRPITLPAVSASSPTAKVCRHLSRLDAAGANERLREMAGRDQALPLCVAGMDAMKAKAPAASWTAFERCVLKAKDSGAARACNSNLRAE